MVIGTAVKEGVPCRLFPVVGMHTRGAHIRVNFNAVWPMDGTDVDNPAEE
jgi:hypothetical protein